MCDQPGCWKYWCADRERKWAEERRQALINRIVSDPETGRETLAAIRRIHGEAVYERLRQACREEWRKRKKEGLCQA